jgi:hypothetical protein
VGKEFDLETCKAAATAGRLDVLKYLQSVAFDSFDSGTCKAAAYGGHLGVLKWLRSEGCPWDAGECLFLAGEEEIEMREWILSEIYSEEN